MPGNGERQLALNLQGMRVKERMGRKGRCNRPSNPIIPLKSAAGLYYFTTVRVLHLLELPFTSNTRLV